MLNVDNYFFLPFKLSIRFNGTTKNIDSVFFCFRCTRFRFGPLLAPQILPRLKFVAEQENVNLTEDGERALMALSNGDMRKVRAVTIQMLVL